MKKNTELPFVKESNPKTTKIKVMINHPTRPWEMIEDVIEVDTKEFNKLNYINL